MFHLYVFRADTRGNLNAYIVKNSVKLALAHVNAEYSFGDSSVSVVVELNGSDRVYCRLTTGVLHSFSYATNPPGLVHFSGFLISEMN